MNFWKTAFWSTLATCARVSSQFVVAKCIALFAGVAAMGVIGQFQSFVSLAQLASGQIIANGVVKYSAEYQNNKRALSFFMSSVLMIVLINSLIVGLVIIVFSSYLSQLIFVSSQFNLLFVLFGITLFGYSFNQVVTSYFNGINKMHDFALMSIVGGVCSSVLVSIGSYFYKVEGALYGFVLAQLILFFVAFVMFLRTGVRIRLKVYKRHFRQLSKFALMGIIAAVLYPLYQIIIRWFIADISHSWHDAGIWQATDRISSGYLLIITLIISTYVLPKYVSIKTKVELRKEVFSNVFRIIPLVMVLSLLVYLFRYNIIHILLSPKFNDVALLMPFQLLGDVFQMATFIFSYVLVAKVKVKLFSITQIIFLTEYLVFHLIGYKIFGVVGLSLGFMLTYLTNLIFFILWFLLYTKEDEVY